MYTYNVCEENAQLSIKNIVAYGELDIFFFQHFEYYYSLSRGISKGLIVYLEKKKGVGVGIFLQTEYLFI